ncbi:efflux RND transporter periplasmic adaptor subunit [Alteromonas oceanisediminis]|uniref:efflux RND transporter periplasmic adaptor subunit n=1 Tax=Alteromonas oceanisediminis TaxID=2836180 RepID=UPI001BD93BFC|nr:efflux RND transporter periplasmic adaptor subunit [Alteromonas oceanisediminis]MBT0587022.1 efflux RND transporter periplasmic adaptor subunit [Alteromonas oceanisediminis]
MNNTKAIVLGGVIGGVMTALVYTFLLPSGSTNVESAQSDENQPLYWVAPMDPNYRRDEPGKSPMGMDLIPVFEDSTGGDEGPGTIKISPNVVNNLGVRTAAVQRRLLHVPIRTVGYVQYNEDTLIHIHPRVEGWVDRLHVKATGEYVKKGDPLYSLYSPELVNAQEELLIAMRRGNDDLIAAARSRLDALQMPSEAIQSLMSTKKVRQTITFSAPQTGFVDNLNIREGFFIKPGTTLMSIGALDEVWVDAEIFERQSAQVTVGLPVTMTSEFLPGKEWEGEVDYVYPTLEQSTRTLRVRLRFKNEDYALKPNMFAQVTIHSDFDTANVLVPSEAVIRTGTQNRVVLAFGDGQFKSIAVDVGRVVDDFTEITTGLVDGDQIVTSAHFLLDSESSISSDFKRMEGPDEMPSSVFTQATITDVMPSHNMITVNHGAINEWDWPEMTMDFTVANHVDLKNLKEGMLTHIEIRKENDGQYVVTTVHVIDEADTQGASGESVWIEASVNSVMASHNMLNLDHGAIEEWEWPAMTMDFFISENIDLSQIEAGMTLHVEITKSGDSDYLITTIHVKSSNDESTQSATVTGTINTIDLEARVVNISRDAIPKWDRPAATLDFSIDDVIDIKQFKVGDQITFTFEVAEDSFKMVNVESENHDAAMDHSNHGGAHE